MSKQMDTIGWYIATLHQLLGHDKCAAALGEPSLDKTLCILCRYENGVATKDEVIERLGVST
jgi:hypothetical protein